MHKYVTLPGVISLAVLATTVPIQGQSLGVFTDHSDVGKPSTIGPGSASYDPATKTYTISGGGENMWATADHFHYVWKKMSGDVTLEATIASSARTRRPERRSAIERRASSFGRRWTVTRSTRTQRATATG